MSYIVKGIGRRDGDGWKDVTVKGEVVFAYGRELPKPYAPGQFERVGNIGWSASRSQYDFTPASLLETVRLIPAIWRDRKERRQYRFRWTSKPRTAAETGAVGMSEANAPTTPPVKTGEG